jgi:hypothetical protein
LRSRARTDRAWPFIENDGVLREISDQMHDAFVQPRTLLALARRAGYSTAAVGKHGPVLLQDLEARDGRSTIVVDDATGTNVGRPLAPEIAARSRRWGSAPPRQRAARTAGPATTRAPGTTTANVAQQNWISDVTTRVVLPLFKSRGKPFVMGLLVARSGRLAAQQRRPVS